MRLGMRAWPAPAAGAVLCGGLLSSFIPLGSCAALCCLVQGLSKGDLPPWAAVPPSLNGKWPW